MNKQRMIIIFWALTILWLSANNTPAQTTAFTYQGSLKNGTTPATGNHDFEFALFDSLAGGIQLGSTLSVNNIPVTDGIFSVKLDFGSQFPGANRFLEIRVRQSGGGAFTPLSPRQQINSSPYSIKSLNAENATNALNATNATTAINAAQLGGVTANQFVQTTDSRLSDERNPLPNSGNYIQNTTTQQIASNFNISGTGNADQFNVATQYNLNGSRVLSVTGINSLFNLFVGINAGNLTMTGRVNSFFGSNAGQANTTGWFNSFFGNNAGQANTTGHSNSFFGLNAGITNTTGGSNTFIGTAAGRENTTGERNTFIGYLTGFLNTTGANNTLIGFRADVGSGNLTNATAIGANAVATVSDSVVLGNNANVGVGMSSFPNNFGGRLLSVASSALDNGGITVGGNGDNEVLYLYANTTSNYAGIQVKRPNVTVDSLVLQEQGGNVGIGTTTPLDRLQVEGIIRVATLGAAGSTQLCRNPSNQISSCSSSIRYKSNINPFGSGMSLIKRLRPVSFKWRDSNQSDFGLVAEEVAEVEPLLVTRNEKGEVEGVKYDRLGVVLLNAVKEQQTQIEQQQQQINALKKLVCRSNPQAEVCQEKEDEK